MFTLTFVMMMTFKDPVGCTRGLKWQITKGFFGRGPEWVPWKPHSKHSAGKSLFCTQCSVETTHFPQALLDIGVSLMKCMLARPSLGTAGGSGPTSMPSWKKTVKNLERVS